MSRTANVETMTLGDEQRKAIEAEITKQEALFKAWKDKNKTADNSEWEGYESLESLKDQVNPNRYNVAAGVSPNMLDAVRAAAKKAGYTVSTFLRYHIERKLGRNPKLPDKDADSENVTISTALHRHVKAALQEHIGEDMTQADFLRTVAAEASGYDLSLEPERLPAGKALEQYKETVKTKDTLLLDLWEDDPEMLARMLVRRGKSFAGIGLKADQVQAALTAGTLSQDSYEAVNAATQAPAEAPTAEPVSA
jgi:hypothetical protein